MLFRSAAPGSGRRKPDPLKRTRTDIANLAGWLDIELRRCAGQEIGPATVESLDAVHRALIASLALLSGVGQDEVQLIVDEMHP